MALRASSALGFDWSQSENNSCWQNQQLPQEIVNGTTTRSPGLRLVTALPTSSTMPIGSWPRTSPFSIVGMMPS